VSVNLNTHMHDTRIPIDIPSHPTALVVGEGLVARLSDAFAREGIALSNRRVLIVVDEAIASNHGAHAFDSIRAGGAHVAMATVAARESEKTMPAIERIWSAALAHGLDRRGLMVAVGGGLTGDVAGFAAATYMRGIDFVQIPTTLLAMVDASIGGKTGVNLALPGGGLGKNLAGSFWQPKATFADPEVLATLSPRELRSGLAECVKHAVLDGEARLSAMERDAELLASGDRAALARLIPESAAIKARIVAADPYERGVRATLNFGHTFGHAIETLPEVDLLHGEAVAIGMVAASAAAEAWPGCTSVPMTARLCKLLTRLSLPTSLSGTRVGAILPSAHLEIRRRMGFDKKNEGGGLRLILPRAAGDVFVAANAPEAAVDAGLRAIL
jgi:3-dehydroquinate synthase